MPSITTRQYAKTLYDFLEGADEKEIDERIAAFTELLVKNRVLKQGGAIIKAYEQYVKEREGREDVTITVAHKITDTLVEDIKRACGSTGDATVVEDPSIIGGVIVKKSTTIMDASVKTQVERLRQTLAS